MGVGFANTHFFIKYFFGLLLFSVLLISVSGYLWPAKKHITTLYMYCYTILLTTNASFSFFLLKSLALFLKILFVSP